MYRSKFKSYSVVAGAILAAFVFISFQNSNEIKTGADQPNKYLPQLKDKKVAVVANQTSVLLPSKKHIIDFLLEENISIDKIFAPEHGFRGNHSAGEHVKNGKDSKTGISIVSLYGNNRKPTAAQLAGIDVIIFDIQDVGARFYTYISTMHLVMEAAAENEIKMIILDRPNPHGWHVDGPVLQKDFESFVGMHQVPIIHGMTIGEYAQMINGEGWLKNEIKCDLEVVKVSGWTHIIPYKLPIAPSPNLPNNLSVNLYPSLCFFEGTDISIGRGTEFPFQVFGHPSFESSELNEFSFTPKAIAGVSDNPKHKGLTCYGKNLSTLKDLDPMITGHFNLEYLIECYNASDNQDDFFTSFFNKLAGNSELQQQIKDGKSLAEIKATWQTDLSNFKKTRSSYLLYP